MTSLLASLALTTMALSVNVSGIIIGILGFVGAFGLAVFVHELGHFLAAKAFKVPVERFVIGMDKEAMGFLPRCIWEKKIGETVYGVSLVPLGGYVKMSGVVHPDIERYLEGEEPADKGAAAEDKLAPAPDGPRRDTRGKAGAPSLQEQAMGDMAALYKKPFWQKFIIYSAGVIMNVILAIIITAVMLSIGVVESAPFPARVAWTDPAGENHVAELTVGDRVTMINGVAVEDSGDLDSFFESQEEFFAKAEGEEKYEGTLEDATWASDAAPEFAVTLVPGETENGEPYVYTFTAETPLALAKMLANFIHRPAYVEEVFPNTPSDKGGMKRGDIIKVINGESVDDWNEMTHIIRQSPNEELAMVVDRSGELVNLKVTPWESSDEKGVGQIGIVNGNSVRTVIKEPVGEAIVNSPARVYGMILGYAGGLKKIGGKVVSGNVKAASRELSGPVGIFQFAYRMTQYGVMDWLGFMVFLNVALAVMNILPFPVLDGGHIMFASYEAVFRRPVPPQVLVPLLNGAVIFILIFFVLVTFNDFWKIFS